MLDFDETLRDSAINPDFSSSSVMLQSNLLSRVSCDDSMLHDSESFSVSPVSSPTASSHGLFDDDSDSSDEDEQVRREEIARREKGRTGGKRK